MGSLSRYKYCEAARIPSLLGMFMHRLVTSRVSIMAMMTSQSHITLVTLATELDLCWQHECLTTLCGNSACWRQHLTRFQMN